MKHSLQSMLITTVLALPTAFGGVDQLADPVDTTTSTHSSSIVATSQRAFDLTQIGRPAAAAKEYLKRLTRLTKDNIIWFAVTCVATKLEELGYPNLAMLAYTVNTEIARLQTLPSKRPQSTLSMLPLDIRLYIAGNVSPSNEMSIGFLDLNDLCAMAQTSRGWNQVAQPMLREIRKTDLVHRLLQGCVLTSADAIKLRFLKIINTAVPFDNILNAAFAVRLWTMKMGSDQHTALVAAIKGYTTFSIAQTTMLLALLPNATPWDIRMAADSLQALGFTDKAIALFKRLTAHAGETPEDMRFRAYGFRKLGSISAEGSVERTDHYKNAVALYERSANHPDATRMDVFWAAEGLVDLGYYGRADALRRKNGSADKDPFFLTELKPFIYL